MSDLIHANELIGELHNTVFKDGDDRSIVYAIIDKLGNQSTTDIDPYAEIERLKEELQSAIEAVEHNRKRVEEEQLKHEIYRARGEADALKWAIRFYLKDQYADS